MNKKRYKRKQQLAMLEYLFELLDNGYSMQQALGFLDAIIANQATYKQIVAIFEAGESFSKVLNLLNYPQITQTIVRFGESSGMLKESIGRSINYLKTTLEIRQKIIRQLQYPLVVLIATIVFIMIFRLFLLPKIEMIQQMIGKNSDTSADIVRNVLLYLPYALFGIVGIVGFASLIIFYLYMRKDYRWFIISLKIPGAKKAFRIWNQIQMAILTRVFFEQGYGVKQLFEEMQKDMYPCQIQFQAKQIYHYLSEGNTYQQALALTGMYMADYMQIVNRGMVNKTINVDLMFYEQYGKKQFMQFLQRGIQILLPLLYANTGLLIILSYLSFLLPMLELLGSL